MPYLTRAELQPILENAAVANGGPLWTRVAEDVDWTIMGQGPGMKRYRNLTDLRANTLERLQSCLDGELDLSVANVIIGGENSEWTTLEFEARGLRKNGKEYFNRYALIMKWSDEGKVVMVRDYLDTALVEEVYSENQAN